MVAIKTEVKNIGSITAAGKAAAYEIDRMIALHEAGRADEIVQETRGWDENKQSTFSQRKKENSNDYRYFPDPDIPKYYLHDMFDLEKMKAELPELPDAKRARYATDYGIKAEDIEVYLNDRLIGYWFEDIAEILKDPAKIKLASNYITSDFVGLRKNNEKTIIILPERIAELITMVSDGELSSRAAKDILAILCVPDKETDMMDTRSAREIAEAYSLIQKNDPEALKIAAQKILDENPEKVAEYKSGKEQLLMFFVGQIMKETKGSGNPAMIQEVLKELLQ
jgi:aspartyl-tRNA(Asn)/glutamyl-tRNA(Gln) amidotransferase subunit B